MQNIFQRYSNNVLIITQVTIFITWNRIPVRAFDFGLGSVGSVLTDKISLIQATSLIGWYN